MGSAFLSLFTQQLVKNVMEQGQVIACSLILQFLVQDATPDKATARNVMELAQTTEKEKLVLNVKQVKE